ncbi:MAG: benzoate/H(+) symporter BenE family transporter [Chloroflexi bacterium]|nr:benzoate/H(+) symporter BenE family transporter [Chloroflexota bacterium]
MMAAITAVRQRSGIGISLPRITRPSVSAATTVFFAYIFVGLTVQVGVLTQLGVGAPEASSWFFITWMTTGLFSLVLSLFTKQPVSINLSVAALVFIAGSASGFSLAQILGANLVVGLVAVALSLLRLNDVFGRIIPPQIAIGVFAGTVMAFMWKTSLRAVDDPIYAAPVIGGFLVALVITRSHLVAVTAAAVAGFVGVVVTAGMPDAGGSMALPAMALPAFDFSPSSLMALGLPLLILTVGVGNVQALAILRSEGFPARGTIYPLMAGAASLVNALGGGHPAAIGGSSIAISSGPTAGPKESRFWAIVLSSIPTMAVALAAVPVIAVVQDLPLSYTLTVGALALTLSFKVLVKKTVTGPMRYGAMTAFVAAALPLHFAGLPMAFWALIAGVAAAGILESGQLMRCWRPNRDAIQAA